MTYSEGMVETADKELFRKFYETQKRDKENFANTLNYYTPKEPWGEEYGYFLDGPVNEEIITTYERASAIHLPPDFRYYMINHSSELFLGYYPTRCGFGHPLGQEKKSMIPLNCNFIESGKDGYIEGQGWVTNYDERVDDPDDENYFDIQEECCMRTIANYGCTFKSLMIMKGNQTGSIWYSDGETYQKEAESFTEFVKNHMNKSFVVLL